jgi:hypothetical protein
MTGLRGRELAQAVVDTVTAHPTLHRQEFTACGTSACLVGWTIALAAGHQPGDDLRAVAQQPGRYHQLVGSRIASTREVDVAAELLGVDRNAVADVFCEGDEAEAIRLFGGLTGAEVPD